MHSISSLEFLRSTRKAELASVKQQRCALDHVDARIKAITAEIQKACTCDYTRALPMSEAERARLICLIVDFVKHGRNDFNSHYIQLLAWHIGDLPIMQSKTRAGIRKLSLLEYAPNPLHIFAITNKVFTLFSRTYIDSDKVATALLTTYLNNYRIASQRFKSLLRRYLKDIKYCPDLDAYFHLDKLADYTRAHTPALATKLFPERLAALRLPAHTLTTRYFSDAWFLWICSTFFQDTRMYAQLQSPFYAACSTDRQKIVQARFLSHIAAKTAAERERLCLQYLLPAITSGDPFEPSYWSTSASRYLTTMQKAWQCIDETFVRNPVYDQMRAAAKQANERRHNGT